MLNRFCVYLLVAASCLGFSLPTTAGEAGKPAVDQQHEGVLFWPLATRGERFRRMYKIFPSDPVARGAHVHPLPAGEPLTVSVGRRDTSAWVNDYMSKNDVAGVMVLQNGKVRLERYAMGFGPHQRWASFSVAKSFTSILLGVALKQGYIQSIDDKVATYIPELHEGAYADVTVRQLLTMTSGVRWNEDYDDPMSDIAQMGLAACVDHRARALAYAAKQPREWPAGTHWNYNTAETDLLGILVQRATHRSLATYLSQTIWAPYGMASDAYWLKDECAGSNIGGSGLSATLGDYARMGQFILDGGRVSGKLIVAKSWLDSALRKQESTSYPNFGYGYLWWTDADGSYSAVGIFGQMIYINPAEHLVVAQVAAWPAATSKELNSARSNFVVTITRALIEDKRAAAH